MQQHGIVSRFAMDATEGGHRLDSLWAEPWVEEKRKGDIVVSSKAHAKGFVLKVEAEVGGEFQNIRGLLHTKLATRQKEWHELLRPGGFVKPHKENVEICYFRYASPSPMSDRSCLYYKEVACDEPNELKLMYWTFDDDAEQPIAPKDGSVRIDFEASHWITVAESGKLLYRYVQWTDAKVHLPDFILKFLQRDILFQEVDGIGLALAKSEEEKTLT